MYKHEGDYPYYKWSTERVHTTGQNTYPFLLNSTRHRFSPLSTLFSLFLCDKIFTNAEKNPQWIGVDLLGNLKWFHLVRIAVRKKGKWWHKLWLIYANDHSPVVLLAIAGAMAGEFLRVSDFPNTLVRSRKSAPSSPERWVNDPSGCRLWSV